jgi:hypothetical protein
MFCEAFQMRLFFSSNLLTYEEFFVSSSALLGYLVLENQRFTTICRTDLVLTHMEIGWKMSKFETLDFLTRLSWGCQTTRMYTWQKDAMNWKTPKLGWKFYRFFEPGFKKKEIQYNTFPLLNIFAVLCTSLFDLIF